MSFDLGAAGVVAGLLAPYFYKQVFGGSNTSNTTSSAGKPGSSSQPTNVDVNNPTPAMLQQAAKLFPGAKPEQYGDYIKANPEMFQAGGNPYMAADTGTSKSLDLSKILGSLSSGSSSGSSSPTSSGPVAIGAPAPQPVSMGGGPVAMQPMTPAMLSMAMQMPAGGQGPALGPAAMNPLLTMLRGRLGIL